MLIAIKQSLYLNSNETVLGDKGKDKSVFVSNHVYWFV